MTAKDKEKLEIETEILENVEEEKILEEKKNQAFYDYDKNDGVSEDNENYDYKLTYFGADYDISGLVKRFKEGKIEVPPFQREFVWNKPRASRFIESLLLGLPSPEIFLYQKENGVMLVIDGFQRLSTLKAFYTNNFNGRPFKLYYPNLQKRYTHLTYEKLDDAAKTKLDYTIIHSTIVRPEEPKGKNYESIYYLFDRLNSGGMNLTPQEIRNCIFIKSKILGLVKKEKVSSFFQDYMKINPLRGKHQEVALRVLALSINLEEYKSNMNRFLNNFLNEDNISEENEETYLRTISFINEKIDNIFFRQGQYKNNLAILDAIFVGVFKNINRIENNHIDVNNEINEVIEKDEFKRFLQLGTTHNTTSIKGRINFFLGHLKNKLS